MPDEPNPFSAGDDDVPFAEPQVITEVMVTDVMARRFAHGVEFVGWATALSGDGSFEERRIVLRFAMPERAARSLRAALNKMFEQGDH